METRPIRKILVATDFSVGARRAAETALALARSLGAQITLFHAYTLPNFVLPDGSVIIADAPEMAEIATAVDQHLQAEAVALGDRDVAIATQTAQGDATVEIVRAAREGDYGLIVLGTHGRTGIKHFLMGSVAERVVRTATTPVLTVRQDQPAAGHVSAPVI